MRYTKQMKLLTLILSLYIFMLGICPCLCTTEQGTTDMDKHELVEQTQDDENDGESDPCSPFCFNVQCLHISFIPFAQTQDVPKPNIYKKGTTFAVLKRQPRLGFVCPVWHPPIA